MPLIRNVLSLLLLAVGAAAAEPIPPAAVWPLDLDTRYLTSNFMERRSGRWHAGLDLKTDERTGVPVLAVEDGWITRIRAEAGAYGRALYLRGTSGRTYVYAHLERFNDAIAVRVADDRARSGRYRCRLHLEEGELRVAAGQVLGLSGQSGTGGPHLHFEVRDEHQRPLDPQDWGFAVADTFPPVIRSITAHPLEPADRQTGLLPSSVAPSRVPQARGLRAQEGLIGDLAALRASGPVAFSALVTDRSDIRGHVLEPKLIEVRLDGELVYRCRNEAFAFAANNVQRLEWCDVAGWNGETVLQEHWLFRRDGVDVAGRVGRPWHLGADGRGLEPGEYRLEVVAEDKAGNRTGIAFPLVIEEYGLLAPAGWERVPGAVAGPAGEALATPFVSGPFSPARWRALRPEAGDPVLATTHLAVVPAREPGTPWAARYLAADWPLDGTLRAEIVGTLPPGEPWVFRKGRRGWSPVGPVLQDEDGEAWFRLSDRGLHAAFTDTVPPVIDAAPLLATPRPPRRVPGVTLPHWRTLPVAVDDPRPGTGVDPATITATLDGAPLILEPDLIRDRVLVTVPDATAVGDHELVLELADRAGNPARAVIRLGCVR